jgi:hypothetical protein
MNEEQAKNDVINRLQSLGYTFDADKDTWVLGFLVRKVDATLKNETNQPEVPDGLYAVYVDMVCGEFLLAKRVSGGLSDTNMNTEAAVKSITEGDTSISFAVDTSGHEKTPFDAVIAFLLEGRKAEILRYRRLAWR